MAVDVTEKRSLKRLSGEQPDLTYVVSWQKDRDPIYLWEREWLVTNGLGGYASGTLIGAPTRRYHGYLIPNLPAPLGRTVMLPRLDEVVQIDNRWIHLSGAEYADGRIDGESEAYLEEFRLDWLVPTWTLNIQGRRLQKRVTMPDGQNTIYVEYRLLNGAPLKLHVRPFFTFRGHDESLTAPPSRPFGVRYVGGHLEVLPFEQAPAIRMALRPAAFGVFVLSEKPKEDVLYRVERSRGMDATEALSSPGYFAIDLEAQRPVAFVASVESWENLDSEAGPVFESNRRRLELLLSQAVPEAQHGMGAQLVLAADQFIMYPASRVGEDGGSTGHVKSIVAGYHWFTDWGRDTMISLEGLTLCTGRYREARDILLTFSRYVHQGLLPNHFPEGQRMAIYNTVDATLWYFHAIDRYLSYTQDFEVLTALYPTLRTIIDHYSKGTLFGIGADPEDGLIHAGADHYALTWMDAKVEDWVVTPRRGKPVEIQALWFNALKLMAEWGTRMSENNAFHTHAHRVYESFNRRFWFETGEYLYDAVDGDGGNDPRLRPNQVFAISLRHPVLDPERWPHVLKAVTDKLWTRYGLRTLSPMEKDYKPRYEGDRWARDGAYHQGLVWPWLCGAYVDACERAEFKGIEPSMLLESFKAHFRDAGIGTISEIFDGDEPHIPRGCIAQAWSVAEALRIFVDDRRRTQR